MKELAERFLPPPEDLGSNPAISNLLPRNIHLLLAVQNMKIKKKRMGMVHLKIIDIWWQFVH